MKVGVGLLNLVSLLVLCTGQVVVKPRLRTCHMNFLIKSHLPSQELITCLASSLPTPRNQRHRK